MTLECWRLLLRILSTKVMAERQTRRTQMVRRLGRGAPCEGGVLFSFEWWVVSFEVMSLDADLWVRLGCLGWTRNPADVDGIHEVGKTLRSPATAGPTPGSGRRDGFQ